MMPAHMSNVKVSVVKYFLYNQPMIVLNEKEEKLVQTIRILPEETGDQILLWASQLADLAAGKPVEWSDSWTDEDIREVTMASLRNFDESEPEVH
jgi:hypothetical protein